MEQAAQPAFEKMVFRKTNTQLGRHVSVSPSNSTHKHLAYGRIILNASTPQVSFSSGGRETGLICLSGSAEVKVDSKSHHLGQYDAIYIPPDSQVDVTTEGQTDVAEFSADVEHRYPLSPFTATDSVAVGGAPNVGVTFGRRANIVAGQPIGFSGTCSNAHAICWVNPAAFAPESVLGAGDAPAANITGPAFYQWDLSLRKLFNLRRESMGLEFRVDAYNAFNQTNWSGLNGFSVNNVGSASFGQITQSFPARVLQFGGEIQFLRPLHL